LPQAHTERAHAKIVKLRPAHVLPARALSKPSRLRWLAAALTDYAIIALAMAGAYYAFQYAQTNGFAATTNAIAGAAILFAVLVIGTRQHAILVLAHDGGHGHASENSKWNDLLTNLLGLWPFGLGVTGYRKFHFAHHRYMGTESDPELFLKKQAAPAYNLPATRRRILRVVIAALLGCGFKETGSAILYIVRRNSLRDILAPIALWGTLSLILWHFNAGWVALLWFTALSTSFAAISRARVWTEHMGTSDVHRIAAPRIIYRLIFYPHNVWCHFEHHRFPSVPFWNLAKAAALETETPIQTIGSLYDWYATCKTIAAGDAAPRVSRIDPIATPLPLAA
jgi:fatty acid desaturase